jgi:1,4-alpha-glucan branching enzyme
VPPPKAGEDSLPDIQFVEFSLVAPDAKSVELAADFNRWRPESLPLEQEEGGRWQVIVPLPPGEYHYAFRVDGAWVQDPDAEGKGKRGGREASIRRVTAP